MRPSQIAVVRSGVSAAIPPISSATGGPSAGLQPSQVGLLREGDGAARLRIQRCGIGSSCDCPPRDRLAGTEHDLHRATAAGGTPLHAASRERMESAFSSDFAAVRVHTGAAAHDAASGLGARALTAGTDILFRAGEYQPGTPGGDRLLAHELAHVVQQAHGLPQGILDTGATGHLEKAAGLAADHASPVAEREAHGAAMIAAMGKPVPALSRQPPTIARQDQTDIANLRLPSDPTGLPPEWTNDPTHMDPNGSRWRHPDGDYLDFHKGRPGKPGWRGKDHWHHNGEDEHLEPGDEIPQPTPVSAPPAPDKEPEDASDSPSEDQAPSGDQPPGDTNSSSSITIEDVVKVLTVLGLSLALVAGIVAALADPEPASKVALAVGDAALAGVILGMLGLSQSGQPSNPGA
ncbi:MAG: DUF4157 domain-containing protein [Streptosporangiaceae bacterium]